TILRKGEDAPGPDRAIPIHFLGIAWIDFRSEALFEESLEDLVRVIFSKPRFEPPPLGAPPILKTVSATPWMKEGSTGGENSFKELVQQGKNLSDSGEFEAAWAVYSKAIELRPDDADTYYNRGVACYYKGDHDRAIADFSKAIELKPDYAGAYYNRGVVYNDKGNTDRAIDDFNKAIELSPNYAQA